MYYTVIELSTINEAKIVFGLCFGRELCLDWFILIWLSVYILICANKNVPS